MANNKLYGYTPKTSNEKDGNRLDRLNPSEFRKGMDYELTALGVARLAESTVEERETATEKVIKNLQEYGGYYSALISYETEYRNTTEGQSKPSFKTYLKEMEDYHMIEVDKTFSNDKMTEPKYKKEDYTVPFKTAQLKEAIKKEIRKSLNEKTDFRDTPYKPKGSISSTGFQTPQVTSIKELFQEVLKILQDVGPSIQYDADQVESSLKKIIGSMKDQHGELNPTTGKLNEDKDDDFDEKEPTRAQIKGIDKSIGDTKEALALAQKKVKELAPDIKKLAKEVNDKIKKNPAGKADYLKVYQSDPDVKAFIKLRKMLKDADLL